MTAAPDVDELPGSLGADIDAEHAAAERAELALDALQQLAPALAALNAAANRCLAVLNEAHQWLHADE